MSKYQPQEFEQEVQDLWEQEKVYLAQTQNSKLKTEKGKIYTLSMFPYPSGAGLHVGHVRIYTGTDVLARYFRMKGYEVLHPMGWDAFGLPAENAAIKAKKNPMDMVPGNIKNFKRQMNMMGFSYDWTREFSTTDPEYYRFTQWLFIQFFKMGLLYKKNTPIHFCPSCKTGLAEEEVLSNGTHERCGKPITKKDLPQWIFRITTYADRLLSDLEGLDWPQGILDMQKNWIGKKTGINITYKIVSGNTSEVITCFTTRPDTNFGATFIVIAPEHPLVASLLNSKLKIQNSNLKDIKAYVEKAKVKTEMEREAEGRKKTGVFTGLYAVNQLTGYHMPIWISDFVLMGFGTGAVVGVPGHDMRDFEFAKEFGLKVVRVVVGKDKDTSEITKKEQVQEEEGVMINSGFLDGMDIHTATQKMMDYMEEKGYGKRVSSYHLRDWIFSRQRYWGEPIPMVYCKKCAKNKISWWNTEDGKSFQNKYQNNTKIDKNISENMAGWFPISEQNLPLQLPHVTSYEPTSTGESPLSQISDFRETSCPYCGSEGMRETDTMPNWAGSCWYFLHFARQNEKNKSQITNNKLQTNSNSKAPNQYNKNNGLDIEKRNLSEIWESEFGNLFDKWLPVDWYLGGAEHAVLHLLYARFWVKAMQDLGFVKFSEPFSRLRNVGMVLAEDHRKMSKSFGNVINPDDVVKEYGADTLRIYEMFMAPFNMEIAWSTAALQGGYRFLNRIWQIYHNSDKISGRSNDIKATLLVTHLHKTIKKVGDDISQTKFNTAIASMMEFLNTWERGEAGLPYEEAKKFLQILSPFAPFEAEKLWRDVFHEKTSICLSVWPSVRQEDLVVSDVTLPIQVDGKVRGTLQTHISASQSDIEQNALKDERINKFIGESTYKIIYVRGKIFNFILDK